MTENKTIFCKLRKVNNSDINLLYNWVNDDEVRNNAINTKKISFDEHKTWFEKKENSPHCVMFILETDKEPVGQVRFDYNGAEKVWEIDYSIAKKFRGMNLAKTLLSEGIHAHDRFPVVGYVRENNKKSNAIFASLGFTDVGRYQLNNLMLIKYNKDSAL